MKILPCRKITGCSAILLPFYFDGSVDWDAFCAHVARTAEAGLIPAVNMDTGYGNLIDESTRVEVLRLTKNTLSGKPFTAGAYVKDEYGASFDPHAYIRQIEQILSFCGIPTIFQSCGLTGLSSADLIAAYAGFGRVALHPPMEGWDATTDGKPTELTVRRWKRFGQSDAKLIGVGRLLQSGRRGVRIRINW